MSKRIINPFNQTLSQEDHNCFGCSPYNAAGLKLEFIDYEEYIEAKWLPEKQFEGFKNILHGGIQATLLDEVAAWVVFTKCKTSGVTQLLKVDYLSPLKVSLGPVLLRGTLQEMKEKTAIIEAKLMSGEGKICAQATIEYYIFPEAVAKRKYNYPGIEAFYR